MKKSEYDVKQLYVFESAPYLKAILKLSLPSIFGQLILVIYNLADTFFLGLASNNSYFISNGFDNALIAGVTISMPIFMILTAISNLFGIGAASVMSRSMGKDNYERARNASRYAFWACLAVTFLYSLLIFLIANPLSLFLSGGDEIVASFTKPYILVTVAIFGLPTALNTLLSHLLRGEGKSMHASIGIMIGGILNVILDPLFIFVLMPIEKAALSAALATGISNFVALLYYIIAYLSMKKGLVISFKFKKKMFNEKVPLECFLIGLPACLMTLCENISYMLLDRSMATLYSDPLVTKAILAGIGSAKKINMFAHSIVRGLTQGVLPLIGYNKASGNRRRMRNVVYISCFISVLIASVCMGINLIFKNQLTQIFLHEASSIEYGSTFLQILSYGAPFSAVAYSIISFFQAVGKPWRSLILALLRKGILDIPLMFMFKSFGNMKGIVYSTPIADFICFSLSIILFFVYIKHHGHTKHATAKN